MLNLRNLCKYRLFTHHVKLMSTTPGPLIDVSIDDDNIALLTMRKKPVNSLCTEMFHQVSDALGDVKKNKNKGVIFTSALPSIFSAGLDLNVLYQPEPQRLSEFVVAFRRVMSELITSPYITATAINGHTSAGGCAVAAVTEYRAIFNGHFNITFNDTALGISPAKWMVDLFSHIMGPRNAELAITSSQIFTPREALKASLVDDIASNKEEAIEKCKQFINKYDHVEPNARAITKMRMRQPLIRAWSKEIETVSVEDVVKRALDPEIQRTIGVVVESIKNKRKT